MVRENRYIVIKTSDIKAALTAMEQVALDGILYHINTHRANSGKKRDKKYVVVSEDWPMYESTWAAIEKWVDEG